MGHNDIVRSHDRDGIRHDPAIVLLVCAATLVAGYVLKACPDPMEQTRAAFACHTDLTALYAARGIDRHVFPYVDGRLIGDTEAGDLTGYDLRLVDGANEYPVLTGLFMWAVGYLSADGGQYLMANALVLGAFGMLTAFLLARMSGLRALLWAASPMLVLYAFHNWDLLVVAAATGGLWAWWRGRPIVAAALFGLGAALKFYPALLLLPLALERWRADDRATAARVVVVGVGVAALVNLPIFVADPGGWWITYRFHALRPPNYDSLWGVGPLYDLGTETLNAMTSALLVISIGAILWAAERRRRPGAYPFLQVCAALVAAVLLWGKVHSPQFALWILPFFPLVNVKVRWWVAYMVDNVLLYVGVFVLGTFSVRALEIVVTTTVYLRAILLLVLIALFLRADTPLSAAGGRAASARGGRSRDRLQPAPGPGMST